MRKRRLLVGREANEHERVPISAPTTAPSVPPVTGPVRRHGPGVAAAIAGVLASVLAHELVGAVGTLTWAVLLGAAAANAGVLPEAAQPGLALATRRLLRLGVVLLGCSLSVVAIVRLGVPMVVLVVVTLLSTLLVTNWLGKRLGLGRARSLLIATGFAICGASAVAAMGDNAEAEDDDIAVAIAMVTICGTVAMVVLPLLQGPLGLSDAQYGAWAGASVHEVGQVVAAAGPAGAAAVGVAVVVKLTRVLLLAPVVAGVGLLRRRASSSDLAGSQPPLVPLFVIGFLACVALRSTGVLPGSMLSAVGTAQTLVLGAALFAMGTGVHLRSLVRSSGRALVLASASTLVVAGVSLAGVLLLV